MDGARFANAVVSFGCSPAEITWRAGVDVLSFGATKMVLWQLKPWFSINLAETFSYRRKRSGHLFSKMRFLSAQLEAYITNDLWLRNAAHANKMAAKLAAGLPHGYTCVIRWKQMKSLFSCRKQSSKDLLPMASSSTVGKESI